MELLWRALAFVVSRKPVARWIIRRAQRTPYWHLDGYMDRFWFFNGYPRDSRQRRFPRLPAIRVHHILRHDYGQFRHDHPWDARTILLDGYYEEERETPNPATADGIYYRKRGDTATLKFEEYHRIRLVSPGGVWSIFFVWEYRGDWGFWINGRKVKHYERPSEFV